MRQDGGNGRTATAGRRQRQDGGLAGLGRIRTVGRKGGGNTICRGTPLSRLTGIIVRPAIVTAVSTEVSTEVPAPPKSTVRAGRTGSPRGGPDRPAPAPGPGGPEPSRESGMPRKCVFSGPPQAGSGPKVPGGVGTEGPAPRGGEGGDPVPTPPRRGGTPTTD